MEGLLILLAVTILFVLYLISESIRYYRKLNQIPLRISVSGTRGKTSVVRTLASVLREHGLTVLAKSTGSEAMYILPDGSLEKISRKGFPTILEQKRLIKKAVKLKADCLITEIMSIHPENHRTETQKLIRPHLTILTNFRADHTDVVGESLEEIAGLFSHDIYPGSHIILPEEESNIFISKDIKNKKAHLINAKKGLSAYPEWPETVLQQQISVNLDMVFAAGQHLGISDEMIIRGICTARMDLGQLTIYRHHAGHRKIWLVNSFAANDPVSTLAIIEKTRAILSTETQSEPEIIGLLALRSDRGERSRQWLDYLLKTNPALFSLIFVTGMHAPVFTRKLANCVRLKSTDPGNITNQIIIETSGDLVVFGVANIHGTGEKLIAHWEETV